MLSDLMRQQWHSLTPSSSTSLPITGAVFQTRHLIDPHLVRVYSRLRVTTEHSESPSCSNTDPCFQDETSVIGGEQSWEEGVGAVEP